MPTIASPPIAEPELTSTPKSKRGQKQTIEDRSRQSTKSKSAPESEPASIEVDTALRLHCSSSYLGTALDIALAAVASKPTQPILSNVRLVATGKTLVLTTTDMAFTIEVTLPATITASGAITVPAKLLRDTVDRAPKGDISLTAKDTNLTLTDVQDGDYLLRGLSAEDFPATVPLGDSKFRHCVAAKRLQAVLTGTAFAASNDEQKKILTAVRWQIDADQLNCHATDGHRVATTTIASNPSKRRKAAEPDSIAWLLPVKVVQHLMSLIDKMGVEQMVSLEYAAATNQVCFKLTVDELEVKLSCICMDLTLYPNVQTVLANFDYPHEVLVERRDLIAKIERLLPILGTGKSRTIELRFDAQARCIQLASENDAIGRSTQRLQSLSMSTDLHDQCWLIDAALALTILKAGITTGTRLRLGLPSTAIEFNLAGDSEQPDLQLEAIYYLMPMSRE